MSDTSLKQSMASMPMPSSTTPTQARTNLALVSSTQLLNSRITHTSFALPLVWGHDGVREY